MGFFALVFALVTFVNHYCYRTFAYDLGINNNAIYDYAHFRWNNCMLMQPEFTNVLSDHFSLYPLLVSPLYWVFGSYTMLVFQWVAILFGGYGIYVYFKRKTDNLYLPPLATAFFFCSYGIISALAFDYHDNVVAAMFVPWFINYFEQKRWGWTAFWFTLILISKENMALWMVFIAIGLALLHYKDKKQLLICLGMAVVAAAYFSLIVKVVIPSLANADRDYNHFRYDALGDNFTEAIITIFTRPLYALELLYTNHGDEPAYNGIKEETLLMVLLSGGWALFFRPQYLVMLLPIFGQKLYSNDYGKWGIIGQYSIEFAPILTIASFMLLISIKKEKLLVPLAILACLVSLISNIWKMDVRVSKWYAPKLTRIYQLNHYQQDFDIPEMNRALTLIPDTAKVSAMTFIVPHLCDRDYIYQYPVVLNASYVVLALDSANTYPMGNVKAMLDTLEAYRHKPGWEVLYDKNQTIIAKRK